MATYAICPFSVVPIRSNSSHKSEQVSQLLFGELVEVLETKGRQWVKVRCQWDNFIGWIATNQLKAITPSEFELFEKQYAYCLEVMHPIMAENHYLPITLGAQLPNFDGIRFQLEETQYTFSGLAVFPTNVEQSTDFLLKIARRFLHAPYLWGGRSAFGIDADGLVQVVFKLMGVSLPREAAQQVYIGEEVDFVEQSRAGDLAFFENRSGKITHV
ncbi:MAG: NlpC/P60 family protein, partial [Bacteroidota bacterium]